MPRRGGAFRVISGRTAPRRMSSWLASADLNAWTALPANTVILDQTLTTAEKARRPFTVVRTRGILFVVSDTSAAVEEPFGAIGFSVVSDQAVAVGVTAVPLPIFDEASDLFFVHQFWGIASGMGAAVGPSQTGVFPFDSKAMRKVDDSEDIAVVIENASALDAALYMIKFRLLIKES